MFVGVYVCIYLYTNGEIEVFLCYTEILLSIAILYRDSSIYSFVYK